MAEIGERDEFREVGHDLYISGLVGSHSGNMSARKGGRITITRSGARLGRIRGSDLIEFDLSDRQIPPDCSSEVSVHLAVYRETEHLALIHGHGASAIALSLIERSSEMSPETLEASYYMARVPIINTPAGEAAASAATEIATNLMENRIVVARGHGTYAVGESLAEALQWTSVLEESCKVTLARLSASR